MQSVYGRAPQYGPAGARAVSNVGRLAQLSGDRLVRALRRLGWTVDRQSGSHVVLTQPGRNPVTVPVHKGKTLKEGTARGILKSAGVTEEDLFNVY